jgi:hypothetical protein
MYIAAKAKRAHVHCGKSKKGGQKFIAQLKANPQLTNFTDSLRVAPRAQAPLGSWLDPLMIGSGPATGKYTYGKFTII